MLTPKQNYLATPIVRDYIEWLTNLVSDNPKCQFQHRYELEPRGRTERGAAWECKGIFDAYEKYRWSFNYHDCYENTRCRGNTYIDSALALRQFKDLLLTGVAARDDDCCMKVCVMILQWGGVLGSETHGNKRRLMAYSPGLWSYLSEVKQYFENDPALQSNYMVKVGTNNRKIVMNSGFTKIYSLLCRDFIIYDGRVGAALGLLVRKFLEGKKLLEVPDELAFYYGKARNQSVNRNPSYGGYNFNALSASGNVHIRNNLKANWILDGLRSEGLGRFSELSEPLRAVESALFMIGYRI